MKQRADAAKQPPYRSSLRYISRMLKTLELAGFFTAHAVLCICGGDPYQPSTITELADGSREINVFNDIDGARWGRRFFADNPNGADRAVLVMDGYVTLEGWRTDALIVEARLYRGATEEWKLTLPYAPVKKPKGLAKLFGSKPNTFKVYRPKFMFGTESTPDEQRALGEAFFRGVDSHKEGSAVWNKHLDQSR